MLSCMVKKNSFMDQEKNDFVERLKSIIDTAIDGIITIDNRGNVETMNPSAAVIFGYDPKKVIGNNIKMLMPEPYHSEHDGYLQRYQKTKKPHIIGIGREVYGQTSEGKVFPMRLAVSEVVLNDRVIYTGIIHDLSDVKKAEKEIIALNKQLERKVEERTYELEKVVNKLLNTNKELTSEVKERKAIEHKLIESEKELIESLEKEKELSDLKSRFVSMASHEFRTPLTTILSSASLIGRYESSEQQLNREKHVEKIKSAVVNLTGILNDFLSLSKLEEGKVEIKLDQVDLKQLCTEVKSEVKGMLKGKRKINHTIVNGSHTYISDKRILKNILFNLVTNAIKYSQEDIECEFKYSEDNIILTIEDHGIGIPEKDQKHLFSRFFRASNVTNIQGTGLGLNIVRRYVTLLNGDISFESTHEIGTKFIVKLPLNK